MQTPADISRPCSPQSLATTLALICAACAAAAVLVVCQNGWPSWNARTVYMTCLSWSCFFWNGARILTYLPSIRLLLKPGASAEHHSLMSWLCWTLSNATTALYLLEMDGGSVGMLVVLNIGNTVMCAATLLLIWRLRRSERGPRFCSVANRLTSG